MQGKIAKWWMPDDVVFVDEIPHTATGKIQKMALRERFKDYVLPTANARNNLAAGGRLAGAPPPPNKLADSFEYTGTVARTPWASCSRSQC